jgi:hypothetical protein
LAVLYKRGIRILFHSNLNDPIATFDPALIGFFNELMEEKKITVMAELGEDREERGGVAVQITKDGKVYRRILHQDYFSSDDMLAKVRKERNYSLAHFYFSLEGLLDQFIPNRKEYLNAVNDYGEFTWRRDPERIKDLALYLDEKYFQPDQLIQPLLRSQDVYVAREKNKRAFRKGYAINRTFEDITAMTKWAGVVVDRDTRFVSIKEIKDAENATKRAIINNQLRKLLVNEFRARNPIVRLLDKMLGDINYETVDSLRRKILWMLVPSEGITNGSTQNQSLVISGYIPGAYQQKDTSFKERNRNKKYRLAIIEGEVSRIIRRIVRIL